MVDLSSMTDRSAPRAFPWIWHIRLAQIFLSIVALGIAASNAAALSNITCDVPAKLAFNIACAVISIFVLVYFILSTGPAKVFRILPWLVWIQLGLDAFMFVFWLAAAGSSALNCNDLCHSCHQPGIVEYDNLLCDCVYDSDFIYKRDTSPASQGLKTLEARRPVRSTHKGSLAARSSMDSILVIFFAITLASTIWWIFTQRQSSGTAAPTIQPPAHEEAGVPMTSTQQTGTHPQMQQDQYYAGQGQPQAQPVYNQSNPQTQYVPPPMHQQPQQQQVYSQPQPPNYQTGPPPAGQ